MICPKCKAYTRVVYAKQSPQDAALFVRRRECVAVDCGQRFTTHETTANIVSRRVRKLATGGARKITDPAEAQRLRIVKAAQAEARNTGERAADVLARWNGVAAPSRPASPNP